MSIELKAALLAFVALVVGIGGATVYHRFQDKQQTPVVSPAANSSLIAENAELREKVAELLAKTLSESNPELAMRKAAEAAVSAANTVGLTAPSASEISDNAMSASSKNRLNEEVNEALLKLKEHVEPGQEHGLNVPACVDLHGQAANASEMGEALTNPEFQAKLTQCKDQFDQERKRLNSEKNRLGCDTDPDKPECKDLEEQEKKAGIVEQLIKLALVATAIYLIVTGNVATGLLLLSMANGMGGSGSGSGNDDGQNTGQSPGQTSTEVVRATQQGSGLGTGGEYSCKHEGTTLSCFHTSEASRGVRIDPASFSPANLSAGEDEARKALVAALGNPNGGAKLILCEVAEPRTSSAVTKGFILSVNSGRHYLMRTARQKDDIEVIIGYPNASISDKPSCDDIKE